MRPQINSQDTMKIALIGYGKMGHMIEQIALSRGHEIVSIIDIDNQEDFESDAFRSADVAIEFTAPTVAWGNVQKAWAAGVKVVSGSTGWMADHEAEVNAACAAGSTLLWSSNFSIGVYIFNTINRQLAHIMNGFPQYEPSLHEVHHVHKLDHPSGTAITLAETLIGEVDRINEWRESEPADGVLPITHERRGEAPGIHSITWNSEADSITITHDAHSRQGFALGAVLAAEFTASHTGRLTMDDLFGVES